MLENSDIKQIRLFSMMNDSIVDGEGFRFAIFTQGCKWGCTGCHNPASHDINGGTLIEIEDIVEKIVGNKMLEGVTISGGEPFLQPKEVYTLIKEISSRLPELNFWIYTGYRIEKLFELASENEYIAGILEMTKVIVDGQFDIELKDISKMRGSTNQRFVDVQRTIRSMQEMGKTFKDGLLSCEVIGYEMY